MFSHIMRKLASLVEKGHNILWKLNNQLNLA